MSCEHVKGLLSAYFDNELTSGEQDVVHTHLQGCSRCQEILEDYRHFNTLLTQLPRVSPSPMLRYTTFSSPSY
ncbi:MAG TPA: zf-HC2 domain-containing protein, partial [Ktedonobacteraceae bacterium]